MLAALVARDLPPVGNAFNPLDRGIKRAMLTWCKT